MIPIRKDKFETMVDYCRNCFQSFEEKEFGEVDSLVFSCLSYLYFHEEPGITVSKEGMSIRNLLKAEYFEEMFHKVWSIEETFDLLVAVVSNPRYRDVKIRYYRNERNEEKMLQFSAIVFSLKDTCHYVAFRGTDWSITGWKEDALLALEEPIASQKRAAVYLNHVGEKLKGELIVGGHSKGGNLAVFAAVYCEKEIRDRILAVYSHDGPGFLNGDLEPEGFAQIQKRIHKSIPQASYFGMLFECESDVKIVQSKASSIMQHNILTWRVKDGELCAVKDRSPVSCATVSRVNKWIGDMSQKERRVVVRDMFDVMDELNIKSIDEFKERHLQAISVIFRKMKGREPAISV